MILKMFMLMFDEKHLLLVKKGTLHRSQERQEGPLSIVCLLHFEQSP
jgi:hypothetical protein